MVLLIFLTDEMVSLCSKATHGDPHMPTSSQMLQEGRVAVCPGMRPPFTHYIKERKGFFTKLFRGFHRMLELETVKWYE